MKRSRRPRGRVVRPRVRPWPIRAKPIFACDGQLQPDGSVTVRIVLGGIPPHEARTVADWAGQLIAAHLPKDINAKIIEAERETRQ